jgi:hypothetical protein
LTTYWSQWRKLARESPSWSLALGAALFEYADKEGVCQIADTGAVEEWRVVRLIMDGELRSRDLRRITSREISHFWPGVGSVA